jgi:hypothetical protein
MENNLDNLFNYFAGDWVSILLLKDIKQSVQAPRNVNTIYTPLFAEGYLLDQDEHYYYLGQQIDNVDKAVNKKYIITVELADPHQELAMQLDESVETPKDDKGVN